MKNILIALIFFVAFIFVYIIWKTTGNTKIQAKAELHSLLTQELRKDRLLLKPITFNASTIDAYGEKISKDKWYIIDRKAKILAPVYATVHVLDSNGQMIEFKSPLPFQILKTWGKIRIDTMDISKIIPEMSTAAVVLTGSNKIQLIENVAFLEFSTK